MAAQCPYHAGRHSKDVYDYMEVDQYQPTNDHTFESTTPWAMVDNNNWQNTRLPTDPHSPVPTNAMQYQDDPNLNPQTTPLAFNAIQDNANTVSPECLQVPNVVGQSSFEPSFAQMLQNNNNLPMEQALGTSEIYPSYRTASFAGEIGELPLEQFEPVNTMMQPLNTTHTDDGNLDTNFGYGPATALPFTVASSLREHPIGPVHQSYGSEMELGPGMRSPSFPPTSAESMELYQKNSAQLFGVGPANTGTVDTYPTIDYYSNRMSNLSLRQRAPKINIDTSALEAVAIHDANNNDNNQLIVTTISPDGLAPDFSDAGSEYSRSELSRQSSIRSLASYRSCHSHQSNHSSSSIDTRGPRRGRRKHSNRSRSASVVSSARNDVESSHPRQGKVGNQHQCPDCLVTFGRKSSMKRHQNTLHGGETRPWTCSLIDMQFPDFPYCCFCSISGGFEACPHRLDVCENKSEEERTFWRRDHFMQHLEGVHHVTKDFVRTFEMDLDQWRARDEVSTDGKGAFAHDQHDPDFSPKPLARTKTGEFVKKTITSTWQHCKNAFGQVR